MTDECKTEPEAKVTLEMFTSGNTGYMSETCQFILHIQLKFSMFFQGLDRYKSIFISEKCEPSSLTVKREEDKRIFSLNLSIFDDAILKVFMINVKS